MEQLSVCGTQTRGDVGRPCLRDPLTTARGGGPSMPNGNRTRAVLFGAEQSGQEGRQAGPDRRLYGAWVTPLTSILYREAVDLMKLMTSLNSAGCSKYLQVPQRVT
jgi:hypothetical protein